MVKMDLLEMLVLEMPEFRIWVALVVLDQTEILENLLQH
jgi:hypothetical protein